MKSLKYTILAVGVVVLTSCGSTNNVSTANETKSNNKREGREKPDAVSIMKQMDANGDGKLSLEEVKGPLKKDFTKVDSNEDGYLSLEELENAPVPERGSGRGQGGRPSGGRQ